eukprot:gene15601-biopygen14272
MARNIQRHPLKTKKNMWGQGIAVRAQMWCQGIQFFAGCSGSGMPFGAQRLGIAGIARFGAGARFQAGSVAARRPVVVSAVSPPHPSPPPHTYIHTSRVRPAALRHSAHVIKDAEDDRPTGRVGRPVLGGGARCAAVCVQRQHVRQRVLCCGVCKACKFDGGVFSVAMRTELRHARCSALDGGTFSLLGNTCCTVVCSAADAQLGKPCSAVVSSAAVCAA